MKKFWKSFDRMMDGMEDMMDNLSDLTDFGDGQTIEQTNINGKRSLKIDGHAYVRRGKYWIAKDMLNRDGTLKNGSNNKP